MIIDAKKHQERTLQLAPYIEPGPKYYHHGVGRPTVEQQRAVASLRAFLEQTNLRITADLHGRIDIAVDGVRVVRVLSL
jgi:hypothetical protein